MKFCGLESHKRTRSRISHFVQLNYTANPAASGQRIGAPHIASIKFFVRAKNASGEIKRLAVCQLFAAKLEGEMLRVDMSTPLLHDVKVDIGELGGKLVTARNGDLFGMLYMNTSGMV